MAFERGGPHGRDDWEKLVLAVRADQPGALDRLITASEELVRVASSNVVKSSDREDAVQDSLELIVRKLDQLRNPKCYPGWAYTLSRRAALTLRHKRSRDIPVDSSSGVFDRAAGDSETDQALAQLAAKSVLPIAMSRLTPSQADVIKLLVCADGEHYSDVSQALGLSMGSLGPTRQRALTRLRADPNVRALTS